MLINCGRGELTHAAGHRSQRSNAASSADTARTCSTKSHPPSDHPLLGAKNCIITPHVGSRTFESVQRQAGMATQNLVNLLKGEKALAQVNDVEPPSALI